MGLGYVLPPRANRSKVCAFIVASSVCVSVVFAVGLLEVGPAAQSRVQALQQNALGLNHRKSEFAEQAMKAVSHEGDEGDDGRVHVAGHFLRRCLLNGGGAATFPCSLVLANSVRPAP